MPRALNFGESKGAAQNLQSDSKPIRKKFQTSKRPDPSETIRRPGPLDFNWTSGLPETGIRMVVDGKFGKVPSETIAKALRNRFGPERFPDNQVPVINAEKVDSIFEGLRVDRAQSYEAALTFFHVNHKDSAERIGKVHGWANQK